MASINQNVPIYPLNGSVVAKNTGSSAPDLSGSFSGNYLFVGNNGGATISGTKNIVGTPGTPIDPRLDLLADYGGPTPTHRLHFDTNPSLSSQAIDAGQINNAIGGVPDVDTAGFYVRSDQRNQGRLRIWSPPAIAEDKRHADMGAYEYQPPLGVQSFAEGTSDGITYTVAAHSRLNFIVVTFDEDVTFPNGPNAAIQLMRDGPNAPTGLLLTPTFVFDGQRKVELSFLFVQSQFIESDNQLGHPSLIDGRYTLTVLGNEVQIVSTGQFIDGAANGTVGSQFNSLYGSVYRLFGDSNDNRSVETADLIQFRLANGGYNVIFDFDGDGTVGLSDFIQFRLRFGGSI